MPRYYFDWHDSVLEQDTTGTILPDVQSAKDEAARALVEEARELLLGERRELSITVRDDDDLAVFAVTLALTVSDIGS